MYILGATFAQNDRAQLVARRPARRTTTTTSAPNDEESEECPEPNGYFADAEQCDKYYACVDGRISERLCPDGMVFNDYDINVEKCDLPYNIDCSTRPKLRKYRYSSTSAMFLQNIYPFFIETPIVTLNCPRLNGYFAHDDASICDKFYYCVDGKFNMIECPAGLVFNPKVGICTWADEAKRSGCGTKDVFANFACPKVNETFALTHPRYADPDDCQYFYVCINGEQPRRSGCKLGQVFDDTKKSCQWARTVPECADFYKDRLTDAELDELENPKPKSTKAPRTKTPSSSRPRRPERTRRPAKVIPVEEEEVVYEDVE